MKECAICQMREQGLCEKDILLMMKVSAVSQSLVSKLEEK